LDKNIPTNRNKLDVFSGEEGGQIIRCLETATGKKLWKDKYDAPGAIGRSPGSFCPRSSPTMRKTLSRCAIIQ